MTSLRADPSKGLNPVVVNSVTYLGAIATFFAGCNILGLPTIYHPGYLAWLPLEVCTISNIPTFITMAVWGVHYVRRFMEVLFVHNYKRKMPYTESIGAPLYYWGFGFFVGWSVNYRVGYLSPHLGLYCPGLAVFAIGEIGNCICHVMLKNLRKPASQNGSSGPDDSSTSGPVSRHIIPRGFLFEYVSCPHYFFEAVAWFGFFLMTFTLAVLLFFVASLITLISYSLQKHKAYKSEFNGEDGKDMYPTNRKALIPFIF